MGCIDRRQYPILAVKNDQRIEFIPLGLFQIAEYQPISTGVVSSLQCGYTAFVCESFDISGRESCESDTHGFDVPLQPRARVGPGVGDFFLQRIRGKCHWDRAAEICKLW